MKRLLTGCLAIAGLLANGAQIIYGMELRTSTPFPRAQVITFDKKTIDLKPNKTYTITKGDITLKFQGRVNAQNVNIPVPPEIVQITLTALNSHVLITLKNAKDTIIIEYNLNLLTGELLTTIKKETETKKPILSKFSLNFPVPAPTTISEAVADIKLYYLASDSLVITIQERDVMKCPSSKKVNEEANKIAADLRKTAEYDKIKKYFEQYSSTTSEFYINYLKQNPSSLLTEKPQLADDLNITKSNFEKFIEKANTLLNESTCTIDLDGFTYEFYNWLVKRVGVFYKTEEIKDLENLLKTKSYDKLLIELDTLIRKNWDVKVLGYEKKITD